MRKRGAHIKHRAAQPPGLVCISLDARYETHLRMSVTAFTKGFATKDQFLDMCDTHDLLALANSMAARPVAGVPEVCKLAEVAILNIHDREMQTGRWGVTADESAALTLLANTTLNFWSAQSGELFRAAYQRMVQMRRAERIRMHDEAPATT
jgi:hypothetical protein